MQQSTEKVLIPVWDQYPQLNWNEKVALLTHRFMQLDQVETGIQHLFEDHDYIREVRIPAGTLIVGRVHKLGHEMQLVEGTVLLIGPDGFRVGKQAPDSVQTGPGFQCVCFTLSNVIARTVHPNPNDSRDIAALEAEIFESPESLLELGSQVERRLTVS
jgi:hypothetical protein